MVQLSRRRFIQIAGGSAMALGLGLRVPGNTWAQAVDTQKAADINWSGWEFFYPGKYNEEDAKILNEFLDERDKINNRGDVNINDFVNGKLKGTPGTDVGDPSATINVTLENMMNMAKRYVPDNPLFNDRDYAKRTKYGNLIAFPLIACLEIMKGVNRLKGMGDYRVITSHNDTNSYYKPFYEGDILHTLTDAQHSVDITPAAGSYYRTFASSAWGRLYNQKGELVGEGANIFEQGLRRHIDPAKRNKGGVQVQEVPEYWSRPAYQYTDEDWDTIIGMWKNEKVRGDEVLYWDDVEIGDEPTPTACGPVLSAEQTTMIGAPALWVTQIKKNMLDPKTRAKMVKNNQGIYVLPEYLEKKAGPGRPMGRGAEGATAVDPDAPKEIRNTDGRAIFNNKVCAYFAAGMLLDWMGDNGWLQRIHWDIMAPGGPAIPSSLIPPITKEMMPALFDKFPYLEKVPFMKGKRASWHALEGDLVITKGYVANKYVKGGEYFIDVIFWCETFDKYLIQEGSATIKLPKKT